LDEPHFMSLEAHSSTAALGSQRRTPPWQLARQLVPANPLSSTDPQQTWFDGQSVWSSHVIFTPLQSGSGIVERRADRHSKFALP
jgi:hypothetical protein